MEIGVEGILTIAVILVIALVLISVQQRINKKYARSLGKLAGRLGLEAVEPEQIENELAMLRLLNAPGFHAHTLDEVYVAHRGERKLIIFKHEMNRMRDTLSETVFAVRLKSRQFPSIRIRPVPGIERYLGSPGPDVERIRFENDKLFDAQYYVRGNPGNENTKRLIGRTIRNLISQFDLNLSIELDEGWLLVYKENKLLPAMEIPRVIDFSLALANHFESAVQ